MCTVYAVRIGLDLYDCFEWVIVCRKNAVERCTIIKNINIDYILIELFAKNSNNNSDGDGDVDVKQAHSNMSVERRGLQINSFEICIEITNKHKHTQTHVNYLKCLTYINQNL